jgi:hypothetical protein
MKVISRSEIKPGLVVLEEEANYGGVFGVIRNCLGIKRPFIVLKIVRKHAETTLTVILDSKKLLTKPKKTITISSSLYLPKASLNSRSKLQIFLIPNISVKLNIN